jgi:dolichol-phosphate mannosyltransferase
VSSPPPARILVSLATYNERGNLPQLLREIQTYLPDSTQLVIDDNSPDGTGQLADELAGADPRIQVIHRPGKQGLGTAILEGMRFAIDHGFDLMINMDADFSHHPRYLPALVAGMEQHDVMIGSRYIPGGGTANWPWSRLLISRSINTLVRWLFWFRARDCSGGFRCYRVQKLREAQLDRIISRGYSFQQEVLYRCKRAGSRIGEIPIVFENRRAGVSKVDWHEATRSLSVLFYLGFRSWLGLAR